MSGGSNTSYLIPSLSFLLLHIKTYFVYLTPCLPDINMYPIYPVHTYLRSIYHSIAKHNMPFHTFLPVHKYGLHARDAEDKHTCMPLSRTQCG